MGHTSFVVTRLQLKCLFVTLCNCLPFLVLLSNRSFLPVFHSYSLSYLNRVSGLGSLLPFSLLAAALSILLFFASFVPLLFMFEMFLFPCMGSMRDKSLRFVRKPLLYLLNATDLTLLNTPLARTGHTELRATAHVNTDTHAVKPGRKRAPEKWPGQGQNVAVPGIRDESGILG